MKRRLTKFFTVLLTVMLVVGMAPATGSAVYAASWNSGSFSSWLSGLLGNSSNENTESNDQVVNNPVNTTNDATSDDSSGTADDITLTKTAKDKGKDGEGNQLFDINLSVKGKEISSSKKVDIVLILDASSSMTTALQNMTKKAATTFVEKVFEDKGVDARVAVISYGTTACARNYNNRWSPWTFYGSSFSSANYSNNKTAIKDAINSSYNANNGELYGSATNTEGAFLVAKELTSSSIKRSDAEHLTVFMTDGVPTKHYYTRWGSISTTGGDSYTTKDDHNEALDAAISLSEDSNIYNVALTGGITGDNTQSKKERLLIAQKLMAQPPYKMTNDGTNGDVTFSSTASKSYAKKYYNITTTNEDDASTQMQEIYSEIASQALSLVKDGVVTDVLPAGFELTDKGKEVLTQAGATFTKNSDGTTTITFTNVPASKDITNLATISVKYVGNGYGAAYTNVNATYSGTLYNGSKFTKVFPKPVAGLHPKTVDDSDSTSVGTEITVDIRVNDLFEKLTVNGYEVSDYTIVLTDENGNEVSYTGDFTATIVDGKLKFTSTTAGTKELYYVVKANITKTGDNFAIDGQTALISRPTKVTIDVYDAANKAFVVDFGKPVTYSADDVFTASEQKANISIAKDGVGTYGNMALNNDKSITYTLKKFMDGIDVFTFNEVFSSKVSLDKTVTMVPATSIYYEDNFEVENEDGTKSTAITYDDNWSLVDKDSLEGDSITNVIGDGEVGYDTNYNKDDSKLSYSAGTIHMVTAPTTATAKASFEFTGTGVDIYSLTNGQTGKIQVAVWKQNSDGNYPKTAIYRKTIDTKYNSGEAYQLPVVNFDGDETPATYKVQITVGKGQTFYLDAVRIYNPIGNVNDFYGEESGVKYVSIREQSLNPSVFTVTGDVFIDAYLDNDAKNITLSSDASEEVINEYTNYGRKTEVVIAPGKTVTLKLINSSSLLQLGARIDAQAPKTVAGGSADGKVTVNGNSINVNSSTDMYYTISADSQNNIVITNNTDKLVAITNLKIK